jgi:hypothetical protein
VFILENLYGSSSQGQGMSVGGSGANSGAYIWGSTSLPGTYTTSQFQMEGSFGFIGSTTTNTLQFNLNQFGAIGEYIDMTFSGTYQDNTGNHTITGVVHVIRDN